MKKCKVCGNKTEVVFNIGFKATPICEGCATAIFLQQAKWYAETQGQELPIHDVVCCGVLEKMNLGWMKLEDGTKCMPYIKGHSDEVMYRVNNCPSCGKYVRGVKI